jgi:anti-sigma-K factor RskA
MNETRSHEELRGALAAEALGALGGPERAEFLAHLAECEGCRAELAELREAAAALAYAAPPASLDPARSERVRARLLARAAADARGAEGTDLSARRGTIPVQVARPRRSGWWATAAAVALLVAAGAYALSLRGRVEELSGRLATLEAERARLRGEVAARERAISDLAGRGVRVIDLAAAGPRAPSGRMFWNPRSGAWTFFAHDLPPVRRDRAYQLWLITPGRKLSAGTFTPGPDGEAVVQAKYDLPADSLRAVAVTEEPVGGVPEPTGPIVILGALSD